MDWKKLKGLTIQDVIVEHHTVYDDDPSVVLWCDNGRKFRIEGGYEEGIDESSGEMRSKLTLSTVNVKREPEYRVDEMNSGGKTKVNIRSMTRDELLELSTNIVEESSRRLKEGK